MNKMLENQTLVGLSSAKMIDHISDCHNKIKDLKAEKAKLMKALEYGLAVVEEQCEELIPAYEGCDKCGEWCEAYTWKEKTRAALAQVKER